jgi:response regulator RpfG family c-di-GMP phosphodiesterase
MTTVAATSLQDVLFPRRPTPTGPTRAGPSDGERAVDGEAGDAPSLLGRLLASSLVLTEDWERLTPSTRLALTDCPSVSELLAGLVAHGLLTEFQAERVEAGDGAGLVLGNYRLLDRVGAGPRGVVYRAEHLELRTPAAVKVLPAPPGGDVRLDWRFSAELRAVAQLQHPNIVAAVDAGRCVDPPLRYFVMEYVPGQDLAEYVAARGPLPAAEACALIHQAASALAEAHRRGLVHRGLKPSNLRVTPEGQAKLLDFGLTPPRPAGPAACPIGLGCTAPELAHDVGDVRADLYSLGGVLFWCLTGRPPQAPPSLRACLPEGPAELDAVVARMMAPDPAERYATAQAVMQALAPFLGPESRNRPAAPPGLTPSPTQHRGRIHRLLIVDDEPGVREVCRCALAAADRRCDEAEDGVQALEMLAGGGYDLVLLDVDMPGRPGTEVCRRLREEPPGPHLKIVMVSGRASSDEMAQIVLSGADDFLSKPFSLMQLQARVKAALRLKDAQDRSDLLTARLLAVNGELEQNLAARDHDLAHARNALVLALAELVGYRDAETGAHLMRLQRYCARLAEEASRTPGFAGQIDAHFIHMLECCAPLHDIGKAGLPDHILLKPEKLDADERALMQTHTVIGADTLEKVARRHGFARAFLQMAVEITRHHHERWDGEGYPDRLAGDAIPLSARIVALADVYDALRSRRVYKPALPHTAALRLMTEEFVGVFDPSLFPVFLRCAGEFERIYRELGD